MLHWVALLFILSVFSALSGQEEISAIAGTLSLTFLVMFVVLFIIAAIFARNDDSTGNRY